MAGLLVIATLLLAGQPADSATVADTAAVGSAAVQAPATPAWPTVPSGDGDGGSSGVKLVLVVAGLAGLGAAVVLGVRRHIRRGSRDDARYIPLFVPHGLAIRSELVDAPPSYVPPTRASLPPEPAVPPTDAAAAEDTATDAPARAPRKAKPVAPGRPHRPAGAARPARTPKPAGAAPKPGTPSKRAAAVAALMDADPEQAQAGPVTYHPPPEGTLQVLPGRLEVLSGTDRAEEIRFIRLPGREPVITFGRGEGEPHAHVRLESPTVSRTHAAMRFAGTGWQIENRSHTNPVVVNGTPMPLIGGSSIRLKDGDIVEMGAVSFRFRER
ncbi:MAG TPA: FHA domain-containing protein [Longimicrobiales bacterium]|nr:FHA domain-containing protein [Longimicrobiales bacterium]